MCLIIEGHCILHSPIGTNKCMARLTNTEGERGEAGGSLAIVDFKREFRIKPERPKRLCVACVPRVS